MADLSRAQVKRNLTELQSKIQADSRARSSFLKDPVAALGGAGLQLSEERAGAIRAFVEKQTKTPGAKVSGAAIRPVGAANDVEVTVSVGVKF